MVRTVVRARAGDASLSLGCRVEAWPSPVTGWARGNTAVTTGESCQSCSWLPLVTHQPLWTGGRYEIGREERKGFVETRLVITAVKPGDHLTRSYY